MVPWLGYAAMGVVAYGLFLLAGAPAAVVLHHLESPPGLTWSRAEGTLWDGRILAPAFRDGGLDAVAWRLSPWRLALGQVAGDLSLQAPGVRVEGTVAVGLVSGDILVSGVTGAAAGASVTRALGLPVPLAGAFALDLSRLALTAAEAPAGNGRLAWREAGIGASPPLDLGTVRAELEGSRLDLSGAGGAVAVAGWVELTAGPGYRLDITLTPAGSLDAAEAGLLGSVGRAGPGGSRRIRLEGAW